MARRQMRFAACVERDGINPFVGVVIAVRPARFDEAGVPPDLARDWPMRGYYGSVSLNAKAVYRRYLSWYDGNPANLNPLPPKQTAEKSIAPWATDDQSKKLIRYACHARPGASPRDPARKAISPTAANPASRTIGARRVGAILGGSAGSGSAVSLMRKP